MARKRMVTRTIKYTVYTVLCADTESAEFFNQTFELSGGELTGDKALKKIAKTHDIPEGVKLLNIVDVHERNEYRGMTEVDFIKHSEIISDMEG